MKRFKEEEILNWAKEVLKIEAEGIANLTGSLNKDFSKSHRNPFMLQGKSGGYGNG